MYCYVCVRIVCIVVLVNFLWLHVAICTLLKHKRILKWVHAFGANQISPMHRSNELKVSHVIIHGKYCNILHSKCGSSRATIFNQILESWHLWFSLAFTSWLFMSNQQMEVYFNHWCMFLFAACYILSHPREFSRFSIIYHYVNNLLLSISKSFSLLYANNCKCLRFSSSPTDCFLLQQDLHSLFAWSTICKLTFNLLTCANPCQSEHLVFSRVKFAL